MNKISKEHKLNELDRTLIDIIDYLGKTNPSFNKFNAYDQDICLDITNLGEGLVSSKELEAAKKIFKKLLVKHRLINKEKQNE